MYEIGLVLNNDVLFTYKFSVRQLTFFVLCNFIVQRFGSICFIKEELFDECKFTFVPFRPVIIPNVYYFSWNLVQLCS